MPNAAPNRTVFERWSTHRARGYVPAVRNGRRVGERVSRLGVDEARVVVWIRAVCMCVLIPVQRARRREQNGLMREGGTLSSLDMNSYHDGDTSATL